MNIIIFLFGLLSEAMAGKFLSKWEKLNSKKTQINWFDMKIVLDHFGGSVQSKCYDKTDEPSKSWKAEMDLPCPCVWERESLHAKKIGTINQTMLIMNWTLATICMGFKMCSSSVFRGKGTGLLLSWFWLLETLRW